MMSVQQSPLYKNAQARPFQRGAVSSASPNHNNDAKRKSMLPGSANRAVGFSVVDAAAALHSDKNKKMKTALTRAAPTVSWTAAFNQEVQPVPFFSSGTHHPASTSVTTDIDIADECRSTGSAASPLIAHLRSYKPSRAGFVARDFSTSLVSPTRTTWTESVATEMDDDFADSATMACLCDSASIRTEFSDNTSGGPCILYQCFSSTDSSANLDEYDPVDESLSVSASVVHIGHRAVSWGNCAGSCLTVEEDIATEAC